MARRKWFRVHVVESWSADYKVLAEGMADAEGVVNDLINVGELDARTDNEGSYCRSVSSSESSRPGDGEKYIRESRNHEPEVVTENMKGK